MNVHIRYSIRSLHHEMAYYGRAIIADRRSQLESRLKQLKGVTGSLLGSPLTSHMIVHHMRVPSDFEFMGLRKYAHR